MALPKIDLPTFKLHLDSLNKDVTFRPFIVKEEKILLMALESAETDTIMNAIKQVIASCVLDNIDVDALPLFEIEKLFLHLRARSMGEIVSLTYICQHENDDGKKCRHEMELEVDLLKSVVESKSVQNTIMLSDTVGIKLKYPTIAITELIGSDDDSEIDLTVKLIEKCTEYLYDEEQVYSLSDMQEGEFRGFIENLTQEQFASLRTFFDSIPKLVYDTEVTCKKCNTPHQIHLEGLSDFFV